jgi:hypothetical protein
MLKVWQVLFQAEPLNREEARRRAVYQLLNKEQQYSLCLQFGLSRFLVPLSERRDLLNATEHYTLFQNAEEVLPLSSASNQLCPSASSFLDQMIDSGPEFHFTCIHKR